MGRPTGPLRVQPITMRSEAEGNPRMVVLLAEAYWIPRPPDERAAARTCFWALRGRRGGGGSLEAARCPNTEPQHKSGGPNRRRRLGVERTSAPPARNCARKPTLRVSSQPAGPPSKVRASSHLFAAMAQVFGKSEP